MTSWVRLFSTVLVNLEGARRIYLEDSPDGKVFLNISYSDTGQSISLECQDDVEAKRVLEQFHSLCKATPIA